LAIGLNPFNPTKMGKALALDFGLKRTGMALTDDERIFAFGHSTVESKDLIVTLKSLILKEKISTIVLGKPKRLDNSLFEINQNIDQLIEVLKKEFPTCEIIQIDERFTSKMASQIISQSGKNKKERQNKSLVDKISATIILQSYLEQNQ
jgi:putative Holliday junction resolvase